MSPLPKGSNLQVYVRLLQGLSEILVVHPAFKIRNKSTELKVFLLEIRSVFPERLQGNKTFPGVSSK